MDLREKQMRVFSPGEDRVNGKSGAEDEILSGLHNPAYAETFGVGRVVQAAQDLVFGT